MKGPEDNIEHLAWLIQWYVNENDSDPEVGFPVSGDGIATNRRNYADALDRVNV